jgi:hypothetical protein
MLSLIIAAAFAVVQGTQPQTATLNVPGTPEHAPTALVGCLMPAGETTSMPGSGGSSGTGPAGMNTDAAHSGVFFTIPLKKKKKPETPYSLVGLDPGQLKQFANAHVQVQGVLLPPQAPPAPDQATAAPADKKTRTKDTPPPMQFRVTAIKQVPGSCGGQ